MRAGPGRDIPDTEGRSSKLSVPSICASMKPARTTANAGLAHAGCRAARGEAIETLAVPVPGRPETNRVSPSGAQRAHARRSRVRAPGSAVSGRFPSPAPPGPGHCTKRIGLALLWVAVRIEPRPQGDGASGIRSGRTFALEDRSGHLANLDVLRSCAVAAVYCGHLGLLWNVDRLGPLSLKAISQGGVALFFVHTSYVLMRSLERLPAQNRALRFYVRRAFRIYPLSILVVVSVLALGIPPFPTRPYLWPGWGDVLSNIALIQNLTLSPSVIDPLWSLPYEVQMYLVLPALFLSVVRRGGPAPLYLWIASVVLALAQETIGATRLDVIRYAPCFVAGVLAFAREQRVPPLRWSWVGWPLVILAALGIRQLGLEAGWAGCLLLGLAVSRFRQVNVRWINAVAAWIARYSYGIYLAHLPVFWLAFVLLRGTPLAMQIAVCAALSALLPVALYHWLEAPMIARGASFAARVGAKRVAAARSDVLS